MATYKNINFRYDTEKQKEELLKKYRGWKPPAKKVYDVTVKHTPMDTIFQVVTKGILRLTKLISDFSEKAATVKEYTPPVMQEEAVNVKVKKPIVKPKQMIDNFITNEKTTDVVREWDDMYATRQQESLHGKTRSASHIDSREGRHGWIQAYNATHANDFDSDPLIPARTRPNAFTFKLKDPNGAIPASPETFLLGYSRIDGCGVYRYYGRDIEAIKQHYNIEELYE